MTPSQLERTIGVAGFRTLGPPGKAVSDSLRWACQHRHAVKVAHGRYVHGRITKQTRYRFRVRVAALAPGPPAA